MKNGQLQIMIAIIGEAGSDKSSLLRGTEETAKVDHYKLVQKLSFTRAAAFLIRGSTIHYWLRMNLDCESKLEKGSVEYMMVRETDLILIDEFSLFSARVHSP